MLTRILIPLFLSTIGGQYCPVETGCTIEYMFRNFMVLQEQQMILCGCSLGEGGSLDKGFVKVYLGSLCLTMGGYIYK